MRKYHKIQTIYKRDEKTHKVIEGEFSLPEFEYLQNNEWVFTEKIDGTNVRVEWRAGFGVKIGGRTDSAQMPIFLIEKIQSLFPAEIFEKNISETDSLCLYGEGYGAKIQKGGGNYNPNGVDFILFDVAVDEWWLKREDIEDVASKLGIKVVPIVGSGALSKAVDLIKNGLFSNWGNFNAEGLVIKPAIELKTRRGDRIITKIKHKDFK